VQPAAPCILFPSSEDHDSRAWSEGGRSEEHQVHVCSDAIEQCRHLLAAVNSTVHLVYSVQQGAAHVHQCKMRLDIPLLYAIDSDTNTQIRKDVAKQRHGSRGSTMAARVSSFAE